MVDIAQPFDASITPPLSPPVDPGFRETADRYFVSYRAESYPVLRSRDRENTILALPWGPRIDVIFDPKNAPGILGGHVRILARTRLCEIELASTVIVDALAPIRLTAAQGCDEYVVKASLGTDPGPGMRDNPSYAFARVYGTGT